MRLILRTLANETFKIDVAEENTVLQLKEKILELRGPEHAVERQRLIYAGNILSDERTIASYNIDGSKFLVMMLMSVAAKSSKAPEAEAARAVEEQKKDASSAVTTQPATSKSESTTEPETKPSASAAEPAGNAASTGVGDINLFLIGQEAQEAIDRIVAMGYPRSEVERAMSLSFNNPDRAVDYLLNGMPENLVSQRAENIAADAPLGSDANPLAHLLENSTFREMIETVRSNPDELANVFARLAREHPQIFEEITQNQDAYRELLNGMNVDAIENVTGGQQQLGGGNNQQNVEIALTNEEMDAVQRLMALGFSQSEALQAYIACDKNEEHAADFLFSNDDN